MKVLRKMFSKRTLTKTLSGILAITMLIGVAPMVSAVEPIKLAESKIDDSTAGSGAFYLATSTAELKENEPAPYYLRVARGGENLPAASVKFEMFDVSAKYGEDYTVEVLNSNAKVVNTENNSSMAEAVAGDGVETMMYDKYGNDLSLTEEAAKAAYEKNAEELGGAADSLWTSYLTARAAQDGIDIGELKGENENTDATEETLPQSDISVEFEKQSGLVDDRVPMKSSSEDLSLGEVLEAGYGMEAMDGIMNELDSPSVTIDFAEGETEKTIVIKTIDNKKGEGDKNSTCKLISAVEGTVVSEDFSTLNFTIKDNEEWEKPTVSFAQDKFTPEGGYAKVTLKRDGISTQMISVKITSAAGTAVEGRDYSQVDSEIIFPPGVNERMVKIPIRSDYLKDGGDFKLKLENPVDCKTGRAETTVVITKGAESYNPKNSEEELGSDPTTGGTEAANVHSKIVGDSLDLKWFDHAYAQDKGYVEMQNGALVMLAKGGDMLDDNSSRKSSVNYANNNHYGITGYDIRWKKTSGTPCWTKSTVWVSQANPEDDYSSDEKLLDTDSERWDEKTQTVLMTKAYSSDIEIFNYKYEGARNPKLYIYEITPILRPFEVTLANAETSALSFINDKGEFVQWDELAETSHAGETSLVGGDVKWLKKDMDEISVKLGDSRFSWIKYLEFVQLSETGQVLKSYKATGDFPQGTQVASVKLTEDLMNTLGNKGFLSFKRNITADRSDLGLKGNVAVRAVLAPYPADFTVKNDDVRAKVNIIEPKNKPDGWTWHKGDYITAETVVNDEYATKYRAVGVSVSYRETGNSSVTNGSWDNEVDETFTRRQLIYSQLEIRPNLEDYDNKFIVKVSDRNLRYYDRTKGFFKTAQQIDSPEAGYKYYMIADTDKLVPNKYYELDAKPVTSTNVAGWRQAVGETSYYENTHYFRTSIKKENNVVELLAPKKGNVKLVLKGTAYYSGATLDKRVEGEAWLPAEGTFACVDGSHFAMVDSEGKFTVQSLSGTEEGVSINVPLYACSGEAFTYKLAGSGDAQYYSAKAVGETTDGVLTVETGKLKVPAINYKRPYIAAAACFDINGVSTTTLPITGDGISTVKVTIKNCGAEYVEDGVVKHENTSELELIAYHPGNPEPIKLATLSKNPPKPLDSEEEPEEPYKPQVKGDTEIWEVRVSATAASGLVSGDKIYLRLTTDRKSADARDEDGNPIENSSLAFTKFPPLDTGNYFIQPAGTIPELIDMDMFTDEDFMADYVKLPLLGSFNFSIRIGGAMITFTPLPGGGQRLSIGYMPAFASWPKGDGDESDTDKNYGLAKNGFTKFGTAWKDAYNVNEELKERDAINTGNPFQDIARREAKFNPIKKGGSIGFMAGIYIDYGRKVENGADSFELIGAGAFAGAMAWYRYVHYFSAWLLPVYLGCDIQLDLIGSLGYAETEDVPTSKLTFSKGEIIFDYGFSARGMFNGYVGFGLCGTAGARGGVTISAAGVVYPKISKRFPKEDELLKRNGYEDGLRTYGLQGDISLKVWIDLVVGTIPIGYSLVSGSMGYFKDLERLEKIYANIYNQGSKGGESLGASGDSDDTIKLSDSKFQYKQAGDPSVWTGSSENARRSSFKQHKDVELKTGGYDHADPQLFNLGENKTLLVYVDEDSRIEGDDRTVLRYQIYDSVKEKWNNTPGVIQAKNGSTDVNGALEPKITDAGDKIMITWTAVVLPNATHDDEDYVQKYLRQRNVYTAFVDKAALRATSSDDPAQINGTLVSTEDAARYNTNPSPLYYKDGNKEYYAITYLSSEAEVTDDSLTDEEKLVQISSNATNNSYARTAEFNSETQKWDTEFDVMKLNSTYNAETKKWTPISDDESIMTDNNPTVIDLDSTVWKDWTIYSFTVDKDNDLATDEDREVFVKIENFKTGNETVNQFTNDAAYTDSNGEEHVGTAQSRPQLIKAADSVYLFWQSGKEDVAWIDLGSVIDSDATNGTTGQIIDEEGKECSYVFYTKADNNIIPTYAGFTPFVDESGNLFIVWTQGLEEDGIQKQELFAQALKLSGDSEEENTNCWSDPVRLTKTEAGDYGMVFNDEPGIVSIEDDLLVVCNRFATAKDVNDNNIYDLSMHGINFVTDASVKSVKVSADEEKMAPGEDFDLTVTVKNDGLKKTPGFDLMLYLVEKDKYDPDKVESNATLVGVAHYLDTEIAPSDTVDVHVNNDIQGYVTVKNSDGSTNHRWALPDKISENGYVLVVEAVEFAEIENPVQFRTWPVQSYENIFNVSPSYTVNISADNYRRDSGALTSKDILCRAVVSTEGNIPLRDTDRLIIGPANLDVIGENADDDYYLDVELGDLTDVESESGTVKSITTDLEIDPKRFEYGFTDLYYMIRDKDGNAVTEAQNLYVEVDAPYYVDVVDQDTEASLENDFVMKAGESIAMSGSYEPACHFTGGNVVYSVEDSNIVKVDENGVLTALKPGTTKLFAAVDIYDAIREYTVTVTENNILGDVNRNGVVDILDATMIQRYTVEKVILSDSQLNIADVNGDGIVDILDAAIVQKYAAGYEPAYPVGKVIGSE